MKKFLKGLLYAVLGIAAIFSLVMFLTGGLVRTADDFFSAAGDSDIPAAHALLSTDFQQIATHEQLEQFLRGTALDQVESASWNSRNISGSTGNLSGTVTLSSGGTAPVKLTLVKETDGWRIHHIEKTDPGASSG